MVAAGSRVGLACAKSTQDRGSEWVGSVPVFFRDTRYVPGPKALGSPSPGHRPRCTTQVKDPSGLVPLVNKVGWLRQESAKTTDPHVLVTWVKEIGGRCATWGTSFTVRTSRTGSGCALRFGGSLPTSFTGRASRPGSNATCVVQRGRCPGLGEPRPFAHGDGLHGGTEPECNHHEYALEFCRRPGWAKIAKRATAHHLWIGGPSLA